MPNHITTSYLTNESIQRTFSFQTISRNNNANGDSLSLLDWIDSQEIISLQGKEYDNNSQSTTLTLSLAGLASGYFSLVRGLMALDQPRSFTLQAAVKTRNFTLQLEAGQEAATKIYLGKILALLNAEIRFKQVLRKVIDNREKFEREERLLFNSL